MKTRVAIVGCGAVASIHAGNLLQDPDVELAAVYGPHLQRASSFASRYGIQEIGDSIAAVIARADVAIVCSPSALHFEQALDCLNAGLHTLVELPPCGELREAEALGSAAQKQGVLLGCAHTSRYLLPYTMIQAALELGSIGEIREISYVRYPQLRARSWTDNALLHHAAHIIDLAIQWCGELVPKACTVFPNVVSTQSASLLARLPGGGPLSIAVSYGAKLPLTRMMVVGREHTVETDGFSYLHSDLKELQFAGDEHSVYEQAIRDQDAQFLGACQKRSGFVPWAETINMIRVVKQFQALSGL